MQLRDRMKNKNLQEQHRHSGGKSAEGPHTPDELIDEASMESFPTSDPPSFTPQKIGHPKRD